MRKKDERPRRSIRRRLSDLIYSAAARAADLIEGIDDRARMAADLAEVMTPRQFCHGVRMGIAPEKCQACRDQIVCGYEVTLQVWEAVACDTLRLCLSCFDKKARAALVRYNVAAVNIVPWHVTDEAASMLIDPDV